LTTDPAVKIKADLETILREAEKAGTLNVLPRVAIYFTEKELRTIVRALPSNPKLTPVFLPQQPYLDTYGNQVMQDEGGNHYFMSVNGEYRRQDG